MKTSIIKGEQVKSAFRWFVDPDWTWKSLRCFQLTKSIAIIILVQDRSELGASND